MPGIDTILQKVLDAVPFRLSPDDGVEAGRQAFRDLPRRRMHPELRVEERTVAGPAGPIPVRVYWPPQDPADTAPPPIVVYFHGGGWAFGDLDIYDNTAREHAVGAAAVVISVGYRLAPEHPYPAALEDCWAVTQWAARHGADVDADSARLAVAGDSAGGNLAAAVTQLARDAGGPAPAFQLLWYPATLLDPTLPSFTENAEAPILDSISAAGFSRLYAGLLDLSDPPVGMAPGRAENLAGLPPAYIGVAGLDPLRDDGIRYAELLSAAGIPVALDNAETLVHGYLAYAGVVPTATEAAERGLSALRVALRA